MLIYLNLRVNDHAIGARFHGYTFVVAVEDNRNGNSAKKGALDRISIIIKDSAGVTVWELDSSALSGGNITIHK